MEDKALPIASRTLLFPGPIAPISHFGVTLLRHVVITGLRSAFHQLGLPLPEKAPVRIFRLRLYFDTNALRTLLQTRPADRAQGSTADIAEENELLRALIDPAGCSSVLPSASKLRGAIWFHQARLRLRRFPTPRLRSSLSDETNPEQIWTAARQNLTRLLNPLRDAFLAEIVASMTRRRLRFRGTPAPSCLGLEAWKWISNKNARLALLGAPDPLKPSWETPDVEPQWKPEKVSMLSRMPVHPLRGRFREQYRAALNVFQSQYELLAESAVSRNILDRSSDAYFLPFDLAGDLAADSRPAWLADAIATNRREYEALQSAPSPPDLLFETAEELTGLPAPQDWSASPLNPMP